MKDIDTKPGNNGEGQSRAWTLLSTFVRAFSQSLFRTVLFLSYMALSLAEFASSPKAIFLPASLLSLIGLWLLLYHFDLVRQAFRRHLTTDA